MAELASRPGARRAWPSWSTPRGRVLRRALEGARGAGQERIAYRILYLEAPTTTWSTGTRPRGAAPAGPADRVVEGIRKERLMMESLRGDADLLIDTSH
jgi:RNase adaptor protein for sRNA GlmZ degradation